MDYIVYVNGIAICSFASISDANAFVLKLNNRDTEADIEIRISAADLN